MTSRKVDENGFVIILNNPISRSGVFQYLGSNLPGAEEPDRIYNVYRPASELENAETIESFKHLPFINDHTMLGPSGEGLTPAEQKGVHGIIADGVAFRDGIMYANLKIFSESLVDEIESGKKDLSLGYRCRYEKQSGIFDGQAYEYVQRDLRGNHIALVDKARCDVSVLDHKQFTFDNLDISETEKKEPTMTLEEALEKIKELEAKLAATSDQAAKDKAAKDAEEKEKADKEAADKAAADKSAKDAEEEGKKTDEEKKAEDKKAMDAMDAEIKKLSTAVQDGEKTFMKRAAEKNRLAEKLSFVIGSFDHSEMTLDEVAKYGIEKLGLKEVPAGTEKIALDGFFHNRTPDTRKISAAEDAAPKSDEVDSYINQKAGA